MRKPAFCICENKDADQLRGNGEADQRLCFRYIDRIIEQSLYILHTKFQASNHLAWSCSPVCVGPGRKPRRPVFSQRGSNNVFNFGVFGGINPQIVYISDVMRGRKRGRYTLFLCVHFVSLRTLCFSAYTLFLCIHFVSLRTLCFSAYTLLLCIHTSLHKCL